MPNRLFVYGTLAPGKPNEHILTPIPGRWESATVKGRLYPEGGGAAAGYPGIILDAEGEEVSGLIFAFESLPQHSSRLDEFEGPGYERVLTSARRQHGTTVDVFIYQLSARPADGG